MQIDRNSFLNIDRNDLIVTIAIYVIANIFLIQVYLAHLVIKYNISMLWEII